MQTQQQTLLNIGALVWIVSSVMGDRSNWPVLGSFPAFFIADCIQTIVLVFLCLLRNGGTQKPLFLLSYHKKAVLRNRRDCGQKWVEVM